MSKKDKFSKDEVRKENNDYAYGTSDENNDEKERESSTGRYSDDISLQAVGKLFEEDGGKDSSEAGDDFEDDYNYYKIGAEQEGEVKAKEEHKERAYIKDDEEYMAYIRSTARSTRNQTKRTLVSPQKVKEATMRHKPVKNYEFNKRVDNDDDFDDDQDYVEYDNEGRGGGSSFNIKIIAGAAGFIALAVLAFFAVKANSLNADLKLLKAENEKIVKDYNTLGIEKSALETELSELKVKYDELIESSQPAAEQPSADETGDENETGETGETGGETTPPAGTEIKSNSAYTVQKGDTLSSIAHKAYGDSSRYKEIMEANGLTSDSLSLGQELLIP